MNLLVRQITIVIVGTGPIHDLNSNVSEYEVNR